MLYNVSRETHTPCVFGICASCGVMPHMYLVSFLVSGSDFKLFDGFQRELAINENPSTLQEIKKDTNYMRQVEVQV